MITLSRDQVRRLDRLAIEEYGIPALVLMENAGRGAAEILYSLGVSGLVLICAGKGNNGADGMVMARHLANRGCAVKVLVFAEPETLSDEAKIHLNIVRRMRIPTEMLVWDGTATLAASPTWPTLAAQLGQAEWIVDALFGTGLTGALRPPFDRIVTLMNESNKKILAVDIPSGLDADTGQPLGTAVRAQHTVTFVAAKTGFANPAAAAWLGQVHVVDIGAPAFLIKQVS